MRTSTRNDIKQLAVTIESLAQEIQKKIDSNLDILPTANELVRNNLTLVFVLGEVSALEKHQQVTSVKIQTVKNGKSRNYQNYHSLRDNFGRFAHKV